MQKNKDFLLEIGCEELPSSYQVPAKNELLAKAKELLRDKSIQHGEVSAFVTPRRLVLYIKDLALKQQSKVIKVVGPPERAAFDDKGELTQAGEGFLKKQNATKKDILIEETPKGKYLAVKTEQGLGSTKEILITEIPVLIKNIHFPKKMINTDGLEFARPIRTICALLGSGLLDITLGEALSVKCASNAESYFKAMDKAGVILDDNLRKETIKNLLSQEARKLRLDLAPDRGLLDEVTGLVETPVIIRGEFNKAHAALPNEVIAASMAKHQRIFSLLEKNKDIAPKFLAIINGKGRNKRLVQKNYQAVLSARLNDAEFFFKEDMKKTLEKRREDLKNIILHQKLGSVYDKTERIKKIALSIANGQKNDHNICKILEKSCELCKSDLTTLMVREMTSLQGIIGGLYAKEQIKSADAEKISAAIYEHYLPRHADDELPVTEAGIIVSLADKIDHVVSFIDAGLMPSSSLDPYGIRRAGNAVVRLVVEKKLNIALDKFFTGESLKFIRQRAETYLADQGYDAIIINSCFKAGFNDLVNAEERIKYLTNIQDKDIFIRTAKICERTSNILKNVKEALSSVNESLFTEELEKALWRKYQEQKEAIEAAIDKSDYDSATKLFADGFYELIHEFFDKVLVNAEDKKIRINRLSLCKAINNLYTEKVADLREVK